MRAAVDYTQLEPRWNTSCVLVSGTIAPAREIPKEDTIQIILANLNLVVPVVAAILVIIVAIIVIFVLRGKGNYNKGTVFKNQVYIRF